jgi:hypothetical protein
MAKNKSATAGHRNGPVRDRSAMSATWSKDDRNNGRFVARREILFPTEASTIGHKKIDRAVERVVARKK